MRRPGRVTCGTAIYLDHEDNDMMRPMKMLFADARPGAASSVSPSIDRTNIARKRESCRRSRLASGSRRRKSYLIEPVSTRNVTPPLMVVPAPFSGVVPIV